MGQNTGMSKNWKNVKNIDKIVDLITEYQNLNSGSRRINGLNSSFARVGKDGPEQSEITLKNKYNNYIVFNFLKIVHQL